MTDAEVIILAADRIEKRARAVINEVGEPWLAAGAADLEPADAEHIAGMSPVFALAVATWLRSCGAELHRSIGYSTCDEPGAVRSALSIARAYLAGEA